MWIKNHLGEKAEVDDADREKWSLQGWSVTVPPEDRDFVWMSRDDVANPGLWAWGARDYCLGIGWVPGPPPEHLDPTREPDPPAEPDDTDDGDDGDAELTRPKPRKSKAAPAAPSKEA